MQQTGLKPDRLLTPHCHVPGRQSVSNRIGLPIDAGQLEAVYAFAERHSLGVPHVFLAMLTSYFANVYCNPELVFGIPAHNRRNHQQKQMLGVFTSISPLAVSLADNANFIQLAKHIGEQQKRNFRHQRYPVGHIINDLQLGGEDKSLYDICYNYLQLDSQLNFEGQAAELVYLSHNQDVTPLTVTVWQYGAATTQSTAELKIDYNVDYLMKHTSGK